MSGTGTKKSLFKKPAWASTSAKSTEEDEPIFGQNHLYQDIIQAEKQRRERHTARQKERSEKAQQEVNGQKAKRRRISKGSEDSEPESGSDAGSIKSCKSDTSGNQPNALSIQEEAVKHATNTPQKKSNKPVSHVHTPRSLRTRSQNAETSASRAIIVVDDDDGNEDQSIVPFSQARASSSAESRTPDTQQQVLPAESDSESAEEDEYLRALKTKARQERRNKANSIEPGKGGLSGQAAGQEPSHATSLSDTRQMYATENSEEIALPASAAMTSSPSLDDDTEVKIWIKTIIPGAKELIVNRKVGQPLDKVREFWIKRNDLDPIIAARVFFIWNGTRLYNSTTMRGLIERLKKTHPTRDGSDPSNGRITIEAVTDEIFEYRKKQRARLLAGMEGQDENDEVISKVGVTDNTEGRGSPGANANVSNGSAAAMTMTTIPGIGAVDNASSSSTTGDVPLSTTKPGIVIQLKAQGLDEISLRVRSNSTMRKILAGFCKLKSINDKPDSWLSYDGDRLDPETTVEEVGFEHEDTVEVYLR